MLQKVNSVLFLDLERLEELANYFENAIIPTAFDHKNSVLRDLAKVQQRSLIAARAYYYMLYITNFPDSITAQLTPDDISTDVLLHNSQSVQPPNPLFTQIVLGTIKKIHNQPWKFASVLVDIADQIPINFFAYSTFPALFGYFVSSDLCEPAAQFVLDLIAIPAPDSVIEPIFLSFLFSSYAFIDALWYNVYYKLAATNRKSDQEIFKILCQSIQECNPLLSKSLYFVIRELCKEVHYKMCAHIISLFLDITFNQWYKHTTYGACFGCGNSLQQFLNKLTDPALCADLITIVSHFITNPSKMNVAPAFISRCNLQAEKLLVSFADLQLFVKLTRPISKYINMADQMQRFISEMDATTLSPFSLDLFLNVGKVKPPQSQLIPLPEIGFELIIDPIFEKAIQLNTNLNTTEFRVYSLKKKILTLRLTYDDQFEYVELKFNYNLAVDFEQSILRNRDMLYSEYVEQKLNSLELKSVRNIQSSVVNLMGEGFDQDRLAAAAFIEHLNSTNFKTKIVPKSFKEFFAEIVHSQLKVLWPKMSKEPGQKYLLTLLPVLTRRKGIKIGQICSVMTLVLQQIFIINRKFYPIDNQTHRIEILQFVMLASNYDNLLDIFFLFEKVLFHDQFFISLQSKETMRNWSMFFQMMWVTVGLKNEFFRTALQFHPKAYIEIERRSSYYDTDIKSKDSAFASLLSMEQKT